MRKYLLAAVAAAAITATPAVARDGSGYIGIEGGIMFDSEIELDADDGPVSYDDAAEIEFQTGLDTDLIAGYDFGMFRAEAELGYKRMKIDEIEFSDPFIVGYFEEAPGTVITTDDLEVSDKANVLSLMGNLLLDFGADDGISFYAGGGLGRARVKLLGDRDSAWAWQGIAGVRIAALPQVDVGLKYRYFQTGKLEFNDDDGLNFDGKFKSHSILASLIYNFAAPVAAPPPPPPPPPAPEPEPAPPAPETVTCPDGSVIPATSECPLPPAPPPPEPAPERG